MDFKKFVKNSAAKVKNVTVNGAKRIATETQEAFEVSKELVKHVKDRDRVHTFEKVELVIEENTDVVEAVVEEIQDEPVIEEIQIEKE